MITLPVMIFETKKELITFIRDLQIICTRHHSARTPSDVLSKKVGIAYAHSYTGMFGKGVKLVIFNRTGTHEGNNTVVYFINKLQSNQLDCKPKGVKNET